MAQHEDIEHCSELVGAIVPDVPLKLKNPALSDMGAMRRVLHPSKLKWARFLSRFTTPFAMRGIDLGPHHFR
jgi:hypothetical protein